MAYKPHRLEPNYPGPQVVTSPSPAPPVVVACWCGLVGRMDRNALDRFTRDIWRRFEHRDLEVLKWAILRKRAQQNAHTFRHTYARLCLEMGARLEELQRFLGHASIRTTEQSYGWLTEQSATTLARARIYGERLRLVKGPKKGPKRHKMRHTGS